MKTTMYIDAMSIVHINKDTGKVESKLNKACAMGISATTVRLFPDDIPILINVEDSISNTKVIDPFEGYEFTLYRFPEGTEVELNG
ncbi:hypothetical protein Novomoskovsk_4 [Bacillus phage Novomoskovsk]|uniref:Uncharacterized protein n=1 Tax=Bacillus phage Novomoskovsk TaxID=2736258 RepID=A0A6M9Z6B9_9CAUD|nr:hypothetical protein Novomoskovsk_4 [Bacillus phage Novomoskovsk]